MATRGRKPKPDALHALAGNPGKRRRGNLDESLPAASDTPARVAPVEPIAPPSYLDRDAQAVWRSLAERLDQLGLLKELDLGTLAQYCTFTSIFERNAKIVAARGTMYTVRSKHGTRYAERPEYKAMVSAAKERRALMTEFGLTPSARARIGAELARRPGGGDQPPLPLPQGSSAPGARERSLAGAPVSSPAVPAPANPGVDDDPIGALSRVTH